MRAFQGTFAVDIWSIKCCVVDIWSIFGLFFWWSIFDKTPVAGLKMFTNATVRPGGGVMTPLYFKKNVGHQEEHFKLFLHNIWLILAVFGSFVLFPTA